MSKSVYAYIRDAWKTPRKDMREIQHQRLVGYRKENAVCRIERPTRLDRARSLGYRAKQGFVMARGRIRRGGMRKHAIKGGRRAKRTGISKITLGKSNQSIAEGRVAKKYPNLEVLNSYWVAEDGKYKWFEIQDSTAYYKNFEKEKIIYPNMTSFLPFVYDIKKYYTNAKCYILTNTNNSNVNLKYLTDS